jgi:hypothetical protein
MHGVKGMLFTMESSSDIPIYHVIARVEENGSNIPHLLDGCLTCLQEGKMEQIFLFIL